MGIPYLIWGTQATEKGTEIAGKANDRDQKEKDEEDAKEAGPPINSAIGAPAYYESRFAFPGRTLKLGDGGGPAYGSQEYADWFTEEQGVAVGVSALRVTLSGVHKGTVVIQNMRLADLKCQPTRHTGTAVVSPPIGDGGDEVEPVDIAFDLTESIPRPRVNSGLVISEDPASDEVWKLGGNAFSKGYYLDGGEQFDARSFDIYFFAGKNDCEFGIEVNVTSGEKDGWYPIKLPGGKFMVAGRASRYESVVISLTGDNNPDTPNNELRGPGNPFTPLRIEKGRF